MKIQCRLIMHIWIFALRITWYNNGSGINEYPYRKDENWCVSHKTKKKGHLKVDTNVDVKVKNIYIS